MTLHLVILFILVCCACADLDYSPYTPDQTGAFGSLNAINLQRILLADNGITPFKVAFIADTHLWNDETARLIEILNMRLDLDFVVIIGDITMNGLPLEYETAMDLFQRLFLPYLVVIGNHDARGLGQELYSFIFGPYNFHFVYKSVHFVVLNDCKLEFTHGAPDFRWLAAATLSSAMSLSAFICHIDPSDSGGGIFTPEETLQFKNIIVPNYSITLHGHWHAPRLIVQDGIPRYVVGSAEYGWCTIITFHDTFFEVEQCRFF